MNSIFDNIESLALFQTVESADKFDLALKDLTNEVKSFMSDNIILRTNFDYKLGKLMGLMQGIVQDYTKTEEICETIGISPVLLHEFVTAYGNVTYIHKTTGETIPAVFMDIDKVKQAIVIFCYHKNLPLTEELLSDLNHDHVTAVYNRAVEKVKRNSLVVEDDDDYMPMSMESLKISDD